ncbi:hypothetical protein ABTD38_09975, partial [Acinetobacter baumannii]
VWCGNSTDGSSPLIFQVNFLSAIRVKYILIGHSAHLSKNLIKYPKWLNIIIEIHKSTYFNP